MLNIKFHGNYNDHRALRFVFLDSDFIADSILSGRHAPTKILTSKDVVEFQNDEECQKYIERKSNYRLVLITSGSCGRKLVPQIHQLSQVTSIYVFCMDEKSHRRWACNFSKVRYSICC